MTLSLDPIRTDLIDWAESRWIDDIGAFRNGDAPEPNLPATLFTSYILYSIDALDENSCDQSKWVSWIHSQQNKKDGSYGFPPPTGSSRPRRGIAFWNAVRSLGILGSELSRFPEYQRDAMTVEGLRDWFETWKALRDPHHEVLALVPTLASHPDKAWVEAFFDELIDQQHSALGTWPKGHDPINISRTFAYSLIHIGMGRLPQQPEKIVDAMLDLQGIDGFWHGRPAFATMDAVYLLSVFPREIGWREPDVDTALNRVADALIPYYQANAGRDKSDTHQFTAIAQTIALLSQALPHRFPTSRPWQFGWSNKDFWKCSVIANELR